MQEVPLFPWWMQLFLAIWSVIGPIVGLIVGHYLSSSWQRKQWVADNKKEEFKNLLGALNKLNTASIEYKPLNPFGPTKVATAMDEVSQASNTCIFIHNFLMQTGVLGGVTIAVQNMLRGGHVDYTTEHWKAVNRIIAEAKTIAP